MLEMMLRHEVEALERLSDEKDMEMARMRGTLNEVEQVAKENANVESRRLEGELGNRMGEVSHLHAEIESIQSRGKCDGGGEAGGPCVCALLCDSLSLSLSL